MQAMAGIWSGGIFNKLVIRYATSTGEYEAVVHDNKTLRIPSGEHALVGPPRAVSGAVILAASYGTDSKMVDVKNGFRRRTLTFSSSALDFKKGDVIFDEGGQMHILGGSSKPVVAIPSASSSGYFQGFSVATGFSTDAKVCGSFGSGRLILGFSDDTYSTSDLDHPFLQAPNSGNYSSTLWKAPLAGTAFQVKQVIHKGGRFMAVGAVHDSVSPYRARGTVFTSSDGLDWTTMTITGTTYLHSVEFDGGRWMAVGDSGVVLTSTNGFEWTRTNIPGGEKLTNVLCANGHWVVGSATGKIYTTTDLSSWRLQFTGAGAVSGFAAGNGKFMALAGGRIYESFFSPPGIADIVSQPASVPVVPGQKVMLSVGATGSGTLSYQWYEGSSGDVSLPIEGATGADYETPPLTGSVKYWVRVSNEAGTEHSQTITLTMQALPVVVSQPPDLSVEEGRSVSTSVEISGNNISYQWYKGFSGDRSLPMSGQTAASFNLPTDAAGVRHYWVEGTNGLGSAQSVAMRAVVYAIPPSIVGEPRDVHCLALEGDSIYVSAEGSSLSYQWYAGATGDTALPVSSNSRWFGPPDSIPGIYQFWVRVTNSAGSVDSRTVKFTVLPGKPVITRHPLDTTTYMEVSKSLTVTASGAGLSYAWYGGESGDTTILVSDSGSSFQPSRSVAGTYRYWVRVSSPWGFVDSHSANYVVKPGVTGVISRHPLDTTTVVSSSSALTVTASGPSLSYQWYAGESGDDSNPVPGQTSSTFYPPVSSVRQQAYWVRVNSGGSIQNSDSAVFRVLQPVLVITDQPLDKETFVGDSIVYYVEASGSNVTYQWYSGMSGDTSVPLQSKTSSTFYPQVATAGVFQYWMRAYSGEQHVDSSTATVTVIDRLPFFNNQPDDEQVARSSGSVSLYVSLSSGSNATLQWYRGSSGDTSNPMEGKNGSYLDVSTSVVGTFRYWVRATNSYGTADSRTATILVIGDRYGDWLARNGLPADGTGAGAPDAESNPDGLSNLLRYALGLGASEVPDPQRMPSGQTAVIGGETWFTLRYIAARDLTDVAVEVEESGGLGDWSTSAVECGPSYNNADGTVTRTFRSSVPVDGNPSGFLRLKVSPKAAP